MQIYHYDAVTGEFRKETEAKPDPMVKGRFLVPENATEIMPPGYIQGQARVFKNGKWVYVVDNRGVRVVAEDGSERNVIIEEFGVKPSDIKFEHIPERSYKEKRMVEYPPIGDQLDVIMKWLATENEFQIPHELKSMAMKCMSVKSKIPKE